jgi:DNA-binding beta-propeller fold protein YncE
MALNEIYKKIYIGSINGNFVYKLDITNPLLPVITELPIDGTSIVQYQSMLDPIDLVCDPTNDRCFIACQKTNEIRVVSMQSDSLIFTIPLGSNPQSMSYSSSTKKLFVSCPDDSLTFPGNRGAIVVIDILTMTVSKKINSGWQPYGLSVDDQRQIVTVANANLSSNGPAPHHTSGCGGRNGYVTFIDLKTLELIPNKRPEVSAFPYGVSSR